MSAQQTPRFAKFSGSIARLPGEKFADFQARQKAQQAQEREAYKLGVKTSRWMRERKIVEIDDDFDYSMNS